MPEREATREADSLEDPVSVTERLLGQFRDASFAHDQDGIELTLGSLADMLVTFGNDMPEELRDKVVSLLDLALEY